MVGIGRQGYACYLNPISFIFMQFLTKNWPNNRLLPCLENSGSASGSYRSASISKMLLILHPIQITIFRNHPHLHETVAEVVHNFIPKKVNFVIQPS